MIFESSKLKLEEIGTIYTSSTADCLICRDLNMSGATLYTVLRITDHDVVHMLIEDFEKSGAKDSCLVDSFSNEGVHIFVFPYRNRRSLESFYMGDTMSLTRCEDICINVILACMTSGLPYPMLYLILDQWKINLNKDDSIFLSYDPDLKDYNSEIREKDCVIACAGILLKLLESKAAQKADSYILLEKKIGNKSYNKFTELYRDVRIAAVSKGKRGILSRIWIWFRTRSDVILGLLFWISLILAVLALAMLLSNLVAGDIPWLRLFVNTFKKIGTESLVQ